MYVHREVGLSKFSGMQKWVAEFIETPAVEFWMALGEDLLQHCTSRYAVNEIPDPLRSAGRTGKRDVAAKNTL